MPLKIKYSCIDLTTFYVYWLIVSLEEYFI